MKIIANIQLLPNFHQTKILQETLEICNEACNEISKTGFKDSTLSQFELHRLCYYNIKKRYKLSAQVTVRCLSKVADAYKIGGKETIRKFKKHSAQPYDNRIFKVKGDSRVSIWCLGGRQVMPFACGPRQRELLKTQRGECDLMFVGRKWYMACVCDVDEPDPIVFKDILGVDLGVVNLAFDSNANCYSGEAVQEIRNTHLHRRENLQKNGSKSAKRKLHFLGGKQKRFQKDVNHVISKRIVQSAKRNGCAIALEDLRGIRSRIKARRKQRGRLHNWGFNQLRQFISYKAKIAGIPVFLVDPKNTSRTCPGCGCVDKRNRPSQSLFSCVSCGYYGIADYIAALNIRARALVNAPMVGSLA